jgi:hypothetical protein
MKMNRGFLMVITGLWIGACDGGDSNSKFSTGLDTAKTPANLSTADRTTFCDKMAVFSSSLLTKADACKLAGMMGAAFGSMSGGDIKALCTAAYDACMKEPAGSTDTTTNTAECVQGVSTCTATVGEIETCYNDAAAMTKAQMAKIPSCSQITMSDLTSASTSTSSMPASCTAVEAKCPDMGSATATGSADGK